MVKDTDKVFVQLIAAEDIKIKSTNGVAESVEKKKPFYIVRSFKHGFPLKKDQIIKLGKTLFQITMIEDGNEK